MLKSMAWDFDTGVYAEYKTAEYFSMYQNWWYMQTWFPPK